MASPFAPQPDPTQFPQQSNFTQLLGTLATILGTGLALSPAPGFRVLGGLALGGANVLGQQRTRQQEALQQFYQGQVALQNAPPGIPEPQRAQIGNFLATAASQRALTPPVLKGISTNLERLPLMVEFEQAGMPYPTGASPADAQKILTTARAVQGVPEVQYLAPPGTILEPKTIFDIQVEKQRLKREEEGRTALSQLPAQLGFNPEQQTLYEQLARSGDITAPQMLQAARPTIQKTDLQVIAAGTPVPGLGFISQQAAKDALAQDISTNSPTMWGVLLKQAGAAVPGLENISNTQAGVAIQAYKDMQQRPITLFQVQPSGAITQVSGTPQDVPGALGALTTEQDRAANLKLFRSTDAALQKVDNLIKRMDPGNTGFLARTGANIRILARDFPRQIAYLKSRSSDALRDLRETGASESWTRAFTESKREEAPIIDTLTLLIAYDIARANEPGGRLNENDFERSATASGYRSFTAEESVLRLTGIREKLVDDITLATRNLGIKLPDYVHTTPLPRGAEPPPLKKGEIRVRPKDQ